MKYFVDYQYLPKRAARPHDDGEMMPIEISGEHPQSLLPNVGDFVHITNIGGGDHANFSGRVRSRLFRYLRAEGVEPTCAVNIVVEETDDDWGLLVKE